VVDDAVDDLEDAGSIAILTVLATAAGVCGLVLLPVLRCQPRAGEPWPPRGGSTPTSSRASNGTWRSALRCGRGQVRGRAFNYRRRQRDV
jgi:hypothetical protein